MVVVLIVPVLAVVGKTALVGVVEALAAGGADALASALGFVFRGHVAEAGVQPGRVVIHTDAVEFGP